MLSPEVKIKKQLLLQFNTFSHLHLPPIYRNIWDWFCGKIGANGDIRICGPFLLFIGDLAGLPIKALIEMNIMLWLQRCFICPNLQKNRWGGDTKFSKGTHLAHFDFCKALIKWKTVRIGWNRPIIECTDPYLKNNPFSFFKCKYKYKYKETNNKQTYKQTSTNRPITECTDPYLTNNPVSFFSKQIP